jgi:hypothetical protein
MLALGRSGNRDCTCPAVQIRSVTVLFAGASVLAVRVVFRGLARNRVRQRQGFHAYRRTAAMAVMTRYDAAPAAALPNAGSPGTRTERAAIKPPLSAADIPNTAEWRKLQSVNRFTELMDAC